METNIGSTDRVVRIALGTVLAVVGLAAIGDLVALGTLAGAVALLVGAILVGTGAASTCPLYGVLGVDTCSAQEA